MKKIGIDYGTKKIGLALTDDGGVMAFPHDVVANDRDFLPYLVSLIEKENVTEVVIGHSLNNDSGTNEVHALVESLITDLTLETGLPIHLEPEQYTTQQAKRIQGPSGKTDASAAALILDSYISKQS